MLRSLILIILLGVFTHEEDTYHSQACVSAQEYRLYELINAYRDEYGLPSIPLSPSLCYVAGAHVWDLNTNQPDRGRCNMHSWSNEGPWTKVKVKKYREHPCTTGLSQNEIVEYELEGWVKIVDDNGRPNVWYYPRGC